ncbi:hypothetical protein F5144DRAFT_559536 [Chaetomium tenue]|uniref:Uncharacterized protein n=1 Tax=Chaetomium tenue TaxID=1854479 RepID=A0ACB7PEF1_9PEZI|nr:hypothetical protein F5144DRAFT_559536 [Chaetomium globosum]
MLPPQLKSAYGQYKQDTDSVASWLASTAKARGYPADLLSSAAASQSSQGQPKGRPKGKARKAARQMKTATDPNASSSAASSFKYTVAIKDFVPLAEWIASRQPAVVVPIIFDATIGRVINIRSAVSKQITKQSKKLDIASEQGHSYFIGILERVREILKPHLPAASTPKDATVKPNAPDDLPSRFSGLTVYEPAEDGFTDLPIERPRAEPDDNVVYEAETQTSVWDALDAYGMMINDLNKIRARIRWIWSSYKDGHFDASAAAIGTNTAIDLARNLIAEVSPVFKGHSIWDLAELFYASGCLHKGFTVAQARDQVSYTTYEVADDLFMTVYNLLRSLADVLDPLHLPLFKDGMFGTYDPIRNRSKMKGNQKFVEDQILLCEIFSELVTVNRMVAGYPVQDEFMRGIAEMEKTGTIPFSLVFAGQAFLDIHHELRSVATHPFEEMMRQVDFMGKTIDEHLEFHKGLQFENWPESNNRILQAVREAMKLVEKDPLYEIKAKYFARAGIPMPSTTPRNRILRSSPVLSGLMLFHFRAQLYQFGIDVSNAFGSAVYTWQLYHAMQTEKFLLRHWTDMDVVYTMLGEPNFHVGDAGKNTGEYFKKFSLQMGVSAAVFANPGRRRQKINPESRAGPRRIKEAAPISRMFVSRYVEGGQQFDWTPELLDQTVSASNFESHGSVAEGTLTMELKDARQRAKKRTKPSQGGHLGPSSLIESLVLALQAEAVELAFPYLVLHKTCWQLLRDVNQRCSTLLIEKFTPAYLEREPQLPWVVGYIFWAANGFSDEDSPMVVRDMRLLQTAAKCFDELLERDKDRILQLMRHVMGIQVAVQVEDEDGDDQHSEDQESP